MKPTYPLLLAAFLFGVIGCTSQQHYDWHDGNAGTGSVLHAGETITIQAINGKISKTTLLGQVVSYELPAGQQEVIARYNDYLAKNPEELENVVSQAVRINFITVRGGKYRLSHRRFEALEEAREFSKRPAFTVIDEDTGQSVPAQYEFNVAFDALSRLAYAAPASELASGSSAVVDGNPTPEPAAATATSDAAPVISSPTDTVAQPQPGVEEKESEANPIELETLKASWLRASAKERELFLRWLTK